MTHPLRQQLGWLRTSVASLVLFVLVGAGHVLPALHFTLVAHRICAEHGELVHEGSASQHERRGDLAGPVRLVAAAAGHDHEHCGIPALPGSGFAALAAPGCTGSVAGGSYGAPPGSERAAVVVVALLAYAPRLPPPAQRA